MTDIFLHNDIITIDFHIIFFLNTCLFNILYFKLVFSREGSQVAVVVGATSIISPGNTIVLSRLQLVVFRFFSSISCKYLFVQFQISGSLI